MSFNNKQDKNYQAIIDNQDVSNLKKLIPHLACDFEFKLDDFQARSIFRLEQNQSVFVSAPTSAGKTVIAQYAISLCLKHKKRVIYTSPIKALSNQKFREFKKEFDNVGILTGDVTINKQAPVLIMTTEIFLSMLYGNDTEILPEVECVIFDEFHYIANEDRGCVWEESIILMPPEINMVFLSATMPNTKEIANWIATSKKRNVYIEIHEERPVPLLHSVYVSNEIINIVGSDQKFNEEGYKKLEGIKPKKKEKKSQKEKLERYDNLILNLQKNDLLPALLFIFTIDGIEKKASMLMDSNINLLTPEETDHVVNFFNQTIQKIPESDRELPQITEMIGLLKKGIGIHHSGLFPILKEIVEILLSEGYIKIILCTSTIGMGLNLPVRTCCFTSLKKFIGRGKANLTLTEYQQMSGRAGRRGNDKFGTSLLCIDKNIPSKSYLQNLFCGKAEKITSQFQISFKMVLNSIKNEEKMGIKEIIENTFLQSENQPQNRRVEEIIVDLKKKLKSLDHVSTCSIQKIDPQEEQNQNNGEQQEQNKKQKRKDQQQQNDDDNQKELKRERKQKPKIMKQKQDDDDDDDEQEVSPKGRKQQQKQKPKGKKQQQDNDNDNDIQEQEQNPKGRRKQQKQQQRQKPKGKQQQDDDDDNAQEQEKLSSGSDDIEEADFSDPIYDFVNHTNKAIEFNSKIIAGNRSDIIKSLHKGMIVLLIERNAAYIGFVDNFNTKGKKKILSDVTVYSSGRSLICKGKEIKKLIFLTLPVDNYSNLDNQAKNLMLKNFNPNEQLQTYSQIFNIKSKKFVSLSNLLHNQVLNILSSKCFMCKFLSNDFKKAILETNYLNQIQSNKNLLNKKGNIEYQCYLNLLQEMDYIEKVDDHFTLNDKGLVASDINGHEIFSTELLFSDVFDDCSAEYLAALCSCLVPHRKKYKSENDKNLPSDLIEKVEGMKEVARLVKEKMSNNAIPFDKDGFIDSNINTSTLSAVFSWTNGETFDKVMQKMNNMLEGHFVAMIKMERSLLVNFANATKSIGLDDLSDKFNEAVDILNHGIISIRSIYLDDA